MEPYNILLVELFTKCSFALERGKKKLNGKVSSNCKN